MLNEPLDDKPDNKPEVEVSPDLQSFVGFESYSHSDSDTELPFISQRLGSLVLDTDTVLRPHQVDAFNDAVTFFANGGREGYIQLPTGTGKTVIMVEFCKKLLESTPEGQRKPRVIVLEPSIDLVEQTVGSIDEETGKRRGFKGFASEIDSRPVHSKISRHEREDSLLEAEVLVTTYDSFRSLIDDFKVATSKTPEQWDAEKQVVVSRAREVKEISARLQGERRQFIRAAYKEQKVTQTRLKVENILKDKDIQVDPKHLQHFEAIYEICSGDASDSSILRRIRPHLRALVTPKIKEGLKAYDATVKRSRERASINRERVNKGLTRLEWPLSEEEEADKIYKGFSPAEAVVMQLIYSMRLKDSPAATDLLRYSDRETVKRYNSQIEDSRFAHVQAKREGELADYYSLVVEAVGFFDLVMCDEVHRAIGSETWKAIREYAEVRDIAILGLTATDQYLDRHLESFFEEKAHELSKIEAIKRQIINPLAIFVHDTGLNFQNVGLSPNGDYDRTTISEMRFNEKRNEIGVEYARLLSEQGYSGIMSAIPGELGEHARLLADMISQQEMVDPKTGETRLMVAEVVLQDTPNRKEIYDSFEAGQIDWLTFVDVIREGWDSDRAKALINMRPTRSPLLATQRAGRIGRKYDGAPISVVIDIHDGIQGDDAISQMPAVSMADVYDLDDVEQGHIIGSEDSVSTPQLDILRTKMSGSIVAHHNRYRSVLANAFTVDARGIALGGETKGSRNDWQTYDAIATGFNGYLPRAILQEAASGESPAVKTTKGQNGHRLVVLYNVEDVKKLHQDKPVINPWKLFIDESGDRWITPEGCVRLVSKKLPNISSEDIEYMINEIETASGLEFQKNVARVQVSYREQSVERFGLTQLFRLDEITDRLVPKLIDK